METNGYYNWRDFGIRVKNARNSLGMTVEKLAEQTGKSENFIFKIESGQSCSINTLIQLSKALNKPTNYFLFGKDAKTEEYNYSDKEILNNILNQCNENQLKIVKEILIVILHNFDDLKNKTM